MSKGQTASKRGRQRQQKNQKSKNLRRKQINDRIEELEEQTKLSRAEEQYEREIIDRKHRTFKKKCISVLRNIGYGTFIAVLILAILSLASLIVLYLASDIDVTKIFNIVQLLSGIISVVVGIWALVLTYKSQQKSDEHSLHIREIIVDADSLEGYKENDLNPKSLG